MTRTLTSQMENITMVSQIRTTDTSRAYLIYSTDQDPEIHHCEDEEDLKYTIREYMSNYNIQDVQWIAVDKMHKSEIKLDLHST